jgi:hypothetical protein
MYAIDWDDVSEISYRERILVIQWMISMWEELHVPPLPDDDVVLV